MTTDTDEEDLVTCVDCGDEDTKDALVEDDSGNFYCTGCEPVDCSCCGDTLTRGEMEDTWHGLKCETCNLNTCSNCNQCQACSNCECYYCEGCGGYFIYDDFSSDCDMCNGCADYGDNDEASGYGTTLVPGWETRNVTITTTNRTKEWTDVWEIDQSRNLLSEFADFYLLEYPRWNLYQIDAHHPSISAARKAQDELVTELAPTFAAYLDMAIGGELRHHKACASSLRTGGSRAAAWSAWADIRAAAGADALIDAHDLSMEVEGNSFLGKAWANICKVLWEYEVGYIDARTFVDRAFSLCHNGGYAFNKIEWATHWTGLNYLQIQHNLGPAQAQQLPDLGFLLFFTTADNYKIVMDYFKAAKRKPDLTQNLSIQGTVAYLRRAHSKQLLIQIDHLMSNPAAQHLDVTPLIIKTQLADWEKSLAKIMAAIDTWENTEKFLWRNGCCLFCTEETRKFRHHVFSRAGFDINYMWTMIDQINTTYDNHPFLDDAVAALRPAVKRLTDTFLASQTPSLVCAQRKQPAS